MLPPFGQIPTFEAGGIIPLFASGAIVLHIATCYAGRLLPADADARARAVSWMFAALSTVEPSIVDREVATYLDRDEPWFAQRLRAAEDRIRGKLDDLSLRLGAADWLDGDFSAGDLMIVDVLRRLGGSTLLEDYPNLRAHVDRAEMRPAFLIFFHAQRAFFKAQLAARQKPANRRSVQDD